MAVYAIGDVQGCHAPLQRLLDHINFDPTADRLWFTGDLVNRGPESLAVLRLVRGLGDAAVTVLGNHDLHLLAIHAHRDRLKPRDTFDDVLAAPDCDELIHWLRLRPLLHHDAELGWTMVHAGLPPQWDLNTARSLAAEAETVLRGPDDQYVDFLAHMYGNLPDHWDPALAGRDRIRFIINCLTRLRYCDETGRLQLKVKQGPNEAPASVYPWFRAPDQRRGDARVVFGHWSTLGYYEKDNVLALDTGCVWGGLLTAARIDGEAVQPRRVPCPAAQTPGKAV